MDLHKINLQLEAVYQEQAKAAKIIYNELEAEAVNIQEKIKQLVLIKDLTASQNALTKEAVQRCNDIVDMMETAKHNYYTAVSTGYAGCFKDAATSYYLLLDNYQCLTDYISNENKLLNQITGAAS